MFELLLSIVEVPLEFHMDVNLRGPGLVGAAVSSFLTTLIVGAILIALAPDYTERMTDQIADNPVTFFLYGFLLLIVLLLLAIILAITIVGLLFAIPLLIIAYVVWAVGATIGFLTIGERLVESDEWLKPLLVGAAINGALALTGIGGIVSFVVGATGFGAILSDFFE